MKYLALFSLFLIGLSVGYSQVDSEWRGIDRTGVYNEEGLLEEWPTEGPELLWSIENLPKGYSSVAVANSMVYFTGIADSMDVLIASDLNGTLKWQTPYGRGWNSSFPDSRCTPTIEGERIYVSSGLGDVACVNANSGVIVWSLKASERFEGIFHRWGISESLLIVDEKLIYTPGGDKTTMVALDKNTGKTVWATRSLHDYPSYISPLLIEIGEKRIIVNSTSKYIFGVDAEDGNILWTFNFGAFSVDKGYNIQTNTPLYHEGKLFFTSGYDHKNVMLELSEEADRLLYRWTDTTLDVHHGGVVKIGDYIYGANWLHNRMGNWVCMEWETGKVMYSHNWINKGSIIANKDMLYCYEEKTGNIALVKANPEKFEVISSFKVPLGTGPHWSHLVIKDGVLYVRHEDALMAYDIKVK